MTSRRDFLGERRLGGEGLGRGVSSPGIGAEAWSERGVVGEGREEKVLE